MTISIVTLDSAHAVALEREWRVRGHRVTVVTASPRAFPGADVRPIHLRGVVGAASRWGAETAALSMFTRGARLLVRRESPEVLVTFPGTALELSGLARAAVLLADDGHARSQARRLGSAPQNGHPLRERSLARFEAEYRAFPVVVPTPDMADDPSWGEIRPVSSAYGLPAAVASSPSAPTGGLRLVTVGEPGWREGTDRASRIADLASVEYVTVVGAGGEVSDELSPELRFVGEQDREGTAEILQCSHGFVLLARDAANASAGLEALAAGLPIIVTEATGLAPFCAEGAGIVVADDAPAEEYAVAVARLSSEWVSMSRRARELVRERPWAAHASEILGFATGGARVA